MKKATKVVKAATRNSLMVSILARLSRYSAGGDPDSRARYANMPPAVEFKIPRSLRLSLFLNSMIKYDPMKTVMPERKPYINGRNDSY
jgi:hypothetical protein